MCNHPKARTHHSTLTTFQLHKLQPSVCLRQSDLCVVLCLVRYLTTHKRVARLIHTCKTTHSLYMWHVSFISVTWLIHTCDMTHPYMWHELYQQRVSTRWTYMWGTVSTLQRKSSQITFFSHSSILTWRIAWTVMTLTKGPARIEMYYSTSSFQRSKTIIGAKKSWKCFLWRAINITFANFRSWHRQKVPASRGVLSCFARC